MYCVLIETTKVGGPMIRVWPPGQQPTVSTEGEAVERRDTYRTIIEAGLPFEGLPNEIAKGIAIGKYGDPPTILQYDKFNHVKP